MKKTSAHSIVAATHVGLGFASALLSELKEFMSTPSTSAGE